MIYTLFLFLYKIIKVKHICMIIRRDHYIYIDYYGNIWKLEPTHDERMPLTISLVNQP